jgi:hypothetical protein
MTSFRHQMSPNGHLFESSETELLLKSISSNYKNKIIENIRSILRLSFALNLMLIG